MVKNLLAFVGVCVVFGIAAIYHYGYLSQKVNDVRSQIDRETAVARAEARIMDIERRAEDIGDKSRKLRIDARAREMSVEREQESKTKTETAMKNLAEAMKSAGLPKPSAMSPDDLQKTVAYAGRMLKGQEVVKLLQGWNELLQRQKKKTDAQNKIATSMRQAADQLEQQRDKLLSLVTEVRGKLEDLALQRDMASVEKELAELKSNSSGSYSGELGAALKTIQKEIDEKLATVEVLGQESSATDLANPEAALRATEESGNAMSDLDKLFD